MKVGFTCGAFDLLHAGHLLMLRECREQCDRLIVFLQTDPSLDRPEKNKPVQTLFERWLALKSNRFVDAVIVYQTEEDLLHLLNTVKLDIRFVGKDWFGKHFTGKGLHETVYNSRNHNFSTSELRRRVFKAECDKECE